MDDVEFQQKLLQRLDMLVLLQLDAGRPETKMSTKGKIERLLAFGLAPAEVATVIRKPVNYVTAVISKGKSSQKGGDRSNIT